MPTLTINIAAAETPVASGGRSRAGHMWYSIAADNTTTASYGFAPDRDHQGPPWGMWGDGKVYPDDDSVYQRPRAYTRTISITQDQYDHLKEFGNDVQSAAIAGSASIHGFSTSYTFNKNSCIDFVWTALQYSGLSPTHYEGAIAPEGNIAPINRLLNNVALNL